MDDTDLLATMLDFEEDGESTVPARAAPALAAPPPPVAAPPVRVPGPAAAAAAYPPQPLQVSDAKTVELQKEFCKRVAQRILAASRRLPPDLYTRHQTQIGVLWTKLQNTWPALTINERQRVLHDFDAALKATVGPELHGQATQEERAVFIQRQAVAAASLASVQQQQAVQPPSRAASPFPSSMGTPAASPAGGAASASALTPQKQQQQQPKQAAAAVHMQAAAAAAITGSAKRTADAAGGDGAPAAKRAKGGGAAAAGGVGGGGKKKEADDTGMTVDNLYDWDQETNQLMEGLQRDRQANRGQTRSTATNQQFLSEWRLGHEFYRQIQRAGGGLRVKSECFELLQLAFQAHMTQARVIQRSLRIAGHRQDVSRRSSDMVPTSNPRNGVTLIERRQKAKADARAEAERAELLRIANSKRADEDTKERAKAAKAELHGKQQATLANAAVAATLGGASKGKTSKWEKWAAAGPSGGAADAADAGAGAAGGKKKGGGKKGGGKKGGGDSEGGAGEGGATTSAAGSDSGADKSAGGKAPAARGRVGLTGAASGPVGSDDASTVLLKDVLGCLERDPLYAKSGLLYKLYNTPRTAGGAAAAPLAP